MLERFTRERVEYVGSKRGRYVDTPEPYRKLDRFSLMWVTPLGGVAIAAPRCSCSLKHLDGYGRRYLTLEGHEHAAQAI